MCEVLHQEARNIIWHGAQRQARRRGQYSGRRTAQPDAGVFFLFFFFFFLAGAEGSAEGSAEVRTSSSSLSRSSLGSTGSCSGCAMCLAEKSALRHYFPIAARHLHSNSTGTQGIGLLDLDIDDDADDGQDDHGHKRQDHAHLLVLPPHRVLQLAGILLEEARLHGRDMLHAARCIVHSARGPLSCQPAGQSAHCAPGPSLCAR